MGNLKRFIVDIDTLEILKQGNIEGNTYYLPKTQLERSKYDAVNKVLVALGAKWNKKANGHVFDYDITESFNQVLETGIVTDWKKSTDFFYTPEAVVHEILGLLPYNMLETIDILEPSAGQGHILDIVRSDFKYADLHCVEQNPMHCERLKEKGYNPICNDFMNIEPFEVDAVLMNPPFTYEMEHIQHAFKFLNDNGILITICSGGILTKSTKKGKEFKQWFDSVGGYDYLLPANSFKECGTSVNTKMLVITKDKDTEEI